MSLHAGGTVCSQTLGFVIDADCVRCAICRKKQRATERARLEYERLLHQKEKTWLDYLDLAHAALDLVEDGKMQTLDRIRGFVNRNRSRNGIG
ncbi:MAG TPA: hypothetical protein VD994_00285 [Prosthecobacter sp.]|nr:hypothetical protein [Prosthecobacter sp.]